MNVKNVQGGGGSHFIFQNSAYYLVPSEVTDVTDGHCVRLCDSVAKAVEKRYWYNWPVTEEQFVNFGLALLPNHGGLERADSYGKLANLNTLLKKALKNKRRRENQLKRRPAMTAPIWRSSNPAIDAKCDG
ncbi:MAG: hypothetical protein LBF24_02730 [Puniceicoccales bacterium]|jgi:hypothetical protein|nr:hypothetical protein [Puniceicoccales bacterium]